MCLVGCTVGVSIVCGYHQDVRLPRLSKLVTLSLEGALSIAVVAGNDGAIGRERDRQARGETPAVLLAT